LILAPFDLQRDEAGDEDRQEQRADDRLERGRCAGGTPPLDVAGDRTVS